MQLIRIGYWSKDGVEWPRPEDFVDSSWDREEREQVADYLRRGQVARAYLGFAPCLVCNLTIGNLELTDGTYVWPEGLSHYVERHDVRMPAEFVKHVSNETNQIENADVDASWWAAQRPQTRTSVRLG